MFLLPFSKGARHQGCMLTKSWVLWRCSGSSWEQTRSTNSCSGVSLILPWACRKVSIEHSEQLGGAARVTISNTRQEVCLEMSHAQLGENEGGSQGRSWEKGEGETSFTSE